MIPAISPEDVERNDSVEGSIQVEYVYFRVKQHAAGVCWMGKNMRLVDTPETARFEANAGGYDLESAPVYGFED